MPSAVWAPRAKSDLAQILHYIRSTGGRPQTAERLGHEIISAAEQHANLPTSGSRHIAAPPAWRYIRFKRWLIFYQPNPQGIEVMRVIDGARDLPRTLPDLPE
jgi:toxin ParE1/3/4